MYKILFLMVFVLGAWHPTAAQDKSKPESWYTYWALGYAKPTYPGPMQDLVDALKDIPGVTNISMDIDLLGFYWPVNNHHTAVGFIINAGGDRYEKSGDWIQINQYLYGFSAMHFFEHNIGQGFFARGDLGIAKMNFQDSENTNESSDSGWGFLIGGGYGFPITEGTRLMLNGNYSYKKVEKENYGKVSVNLGFMF